MLRSHVFQCNLPHYGCYAAVMARNASECGCDSSNSILGVHVNALTLPGLLYLHVLAVAQTIQHVMQSHFYRS